MTSCSVNYKRNMSSDGKVRYTYTENSSKNRARVFNQISLPNKVVHQYHSKEAGERCHVVLLDQYLSKLPKSAFEQDIFYLRPVDNIPSDPEKPWYTAVAVTSSNMTKSVCAQAGVAGKKSNHSLCAYTVTEMFNAGIPEKVIQD